jgi:cytochrome c peroxidase
LIPPHIKGQLGTSLEDAAVRIDAKPTMHAYIGALGGVPRDAVLQGLAAYVLTRYEGGSAWDRMERSALSTPGIASTDPVIAGYQLFMGKAQCGACHTPPLYTDEAFHAVADNPYNDPGKNGAFRTPTLRGAKRRPHYFHTGAKDSLKDVIGYYAAGANGTDPIASKIRLTPDEQSQILAFVYALTSEGAQPKPVTP